MNKDKVIGFTELKGSDPSMEFVFGSLEPTQFYTLDINKTNCKIYACKTKEEIASESITINDHSDELDEQYI